MVSRLVFFVFSALFSSYLFYRLTSEKMPIFLKQGSPGAHTPTNCTPLPEILSRVWFSLELKNSSSSPIVLKTIVSYFYKEASNGIEKQIQFSPNIYHFCGDYTALKHFYRLILSFATNSS